MRYELPKCILSPQQKNNIKKLNKHCFVLFFTLPVMLSLHELIRSGALLLSTMSHLLLESRSKVYDVISMAFDSYQQSQMCL